MNRAYEQLQPYLKEAYKTHGVDMLFFMLTNILTESTVLLCEGNGAAQLIQDAFHLVSEDEDHAAVVGGYVELNGVVSRKKQLIPAIVMALQE